MPTRPFFSAFDRLPRTVIAGGHIERGAVRSDAALTVFNWISPDLPEPPPHQHPCDQLALIMTGAVEFTVGDTPYRVAAGELLYIPAATPHTIRVIGNETVLNVDIFAPAREDYLHLADGQPE